MSEIDPRALRVAFGSFMTGVTVVTTRDVAGTAVGFTANSFASVSLDPPLLLVCPGRFLSSFGAFESCPHFAVSVLAEGQEAVSNTFASFRGDRFAQVATTDDAAGSPLIDGAAAVFSCRADRVIPAGDHIVLIGEVRAFSQSGKRGLGYAAGSYFSLGLERAAGAAPARGLRPVAAAIVEADGAVYLEPTETGFTLPSVVLESRSHLREELAAHLSRLGLKATVERVYSVYDDAGAGQHRTCFRALATSTTPETKGRFVPVEALAGLRFANAAEQAMLARFALEYRTQSFGLYIGDAESGDIHH